MGFRWGFDGVSGVSGFQGFRVVGFQDFRVFGFHGSRALRMLGFRQGLNKSMCAYSLRADPGMSHVACNCVSVIVAGFPGDTPWLLLLAAYSYGGFPRLGVPFLGVP